jgi:hypothetical protein
VVFKDNGLTLTAVVSYAGPGTSEIVSVEALAVESYAMSVAAADVFGR